MNSPLLKRPYGLFISMKRFDKDMFPGTFCPYTLEDLSTRDLKKIRDILKEVDERCDTFHIHEPDPPTYKVFNKYFALAYYLEDVLRVIDDVKDEKLQDCLRRNALYLCQYSEVL